MINKTVTHYKIISQVGQGGMGVLYLAEDLELNRKAVLKFLPPDMMNDPETNLRFKREAQSAGSLSHPNIVTIYDVGVYENKTFIAMEYVEGKTLRELLKNDELTIERITDISVQISEGLNEAHSKGITHRDIKPENILIDEKGKVKIVDFGLAKIKNVSRGITRQDSTVGTLKYMSPEQIRNQNVDHRSDIWSFGVILYEMITGKYPFKGEHDASLFYSIINQSPEPLARYKVNIGEGFQRIVDKSLDKDSETRYQHIDELLSDLRRERKESGEHKIDKRRTRKSKSRIAVIISAVASVVLGIVLIIYLLNNPTKNIKPPKHTQLTFEGNISLYGPAYDISRISPDGQFTAYLAGGEGNKNSIYVRDNSGDQAIEIFKGLNSVSSLRWSPSGNEIFFSAFSSTSRSSYIIPRLGGKSQELKFNEYGCWSPDEKIIAGTSPPEKIIRLINRETGEVEKTVELKGNFTWLIDLDFSPIGDEIVFLTFDENKTSYIIWIIKTDGTEQQKILEEKKRLDSPRWSHDGNHIYYIQSNNMTQDLMKIEVPSFTADIKPKVIQTGLNMHGFSITRDSKKLCYTKYNVYSNMWNFTYDERTNLFQSKKLSEGTSTFEMPVISPNGEEIAFVHNDNIYKMSIYGSLMKQLTFLNSGCYCPSWSPDGKKIAFLAESKLYSISSEGGSPTVLSNNISGSYIYWGSKSEIFYQKQGYRNYFVYNLMTQKKELLVSNDSVGFMLNPQLSPDSLMVAVWWNRSFENEMVKSLWVISRGDLTQKFLVRGYIFPLEWSEDSKWIYAIDTYKTPSEILKVSVNTRLTKVIYTLPYGKISQNNIDITPDGNTIVCSVPETNSDVWMIENFDPDIE